MMIMMTMTMTMINTNLPCLISASLIQYNVFLDLEKPRGSNPTSPANEPSNIFGAFTPNGNHFAIIIGFGTGTTGGNTGSGSTDTSDIITFDLCDLITFNNNNNNNNNKLS